MNAQTYRSLHLASEKVAGIAALFGILWATKMLVNMMPTSFIKSNQGGDE